MRTWLRHISTLLIAAFIVQLIPIFGKAEAAADAQERQLLFEDHFANGLDSWDLFGSPAWEVKSDDAGSWLTGETALTGPQRAVVKSSAFPYSNADYSLSFDAQGDRFRVMLRYTSGMSYYFLEFKNTKSVELWKYPNSSAAEQVGAPVDISAVLPAFNMAELHRYELEVQGEVFKLMIDGKLVTAFSDSSLERGGIGFSLKSVGAPVSVKIREVEVKSIASPPEPAFAIQHTPVEAVPYNADVAVAFSLADAGSPVTAAVYYAYGDEPSYYSTGGIQGTGDVYKAAIPGTNRAGHLRYYITAHDEQGREGRYPDTGDITVAVGELAPYFNDFEQEAVGSAPSGWTIGGNTRVIQLPDGSKVFNLNGSGSARLNVPMYQNADNFIVKFKAKYERTSEAVQNTWRFRYRATDDNNNNAMEWATHNSKYFLMRKTTLGGNYYIANYVKALLDDWHEYELRVSGITHKLLIDGAEVASGDDSDPLALKKGYFQWNVVGGINLMIDNFSIEPIAAPYVLDLQPSGNYAGIYEQREEPGLSLALDTGATAHKFTMNYTVRRSDGDRAVVATGEKNYQLEKYDKTEDTFAFAPAIKQIGTYEVTAEFAVDGVKQPDKTKKMRMAVIRQAAEVKTLDLDNESKFGLNTHYALNWKDDIIDGARKMGARHHRSGINWDEADRNVKDASGKPVYDYSGIDARLDKLFTYGFNQITVLGIDRNGYYQNGTVNTPNALKAMGDFVYDAVSRYKGKVRQWEMPNEPEIVSKPYIPAEFVQLQKIAYLNMKKADPDAMLLAGDHTSSVRSVLPKELELGSYDYADAFSYHPYVYNAMPDDNLKEMVDGVKELVNAYGGWKDYYLTEGGWPTAKAGYPSVTEETQRDYIVRAFLNYMITDQVKAYEYYNYKNDGTDDRYYDIFWGITDNDGRPKLAYTAVNQLMTSLDKARYVGTWNTGDPAVAVHVFLNDGVPVIAAWKKVDHKDNPAVKPPTSEVTLPFALSGVEVKDINGAALQAAETGGKARFVVSGSPIYITGAPADFVRQAAAQLLQQKQQEADRRLDALRTASNAALIDGDKAELGKIAAELTAALRAGDDQAASVLEQGIKQIYALMKKVSGQIEAEGVERAPGYVLLEALYNMAESASIALSYTLQDSAGAAASLDYQAAVQSAAAAFEAAKGKYSVMPVSEAAVLRMKRYGGLADAAYGRESYADSYAYNLLAREFSEVVKAMTASEPPKFIGILPNVVPVQANGEAGRISSFTVSLANEMDAPQNITMRIGLPDGWAAHQSEPAEIELAVPAGEAVEYAYPVKVPEGTIKGRYDIQMDMVYNGTIFDTKMIQLTVEEGIEAKIAPVKQTIQELDTITLELSGTSTAEKSGKVILTGPDGRKLEPVNTATFSGLKKGDKLKLDFYWTYHSFVPFNEYLVDVQIEANDGRTIFHDPAMPLDFNLVQKAGELVIDGALDGWEDAFPFHLRRNDQNASGYHEPDKLEATAYTKWAEDGIYFAVRVKDDVHKQSENAANLWKNDSIQITLDPLNNRESPYGADDVEWGFALADDGRLLVNIFNSMPPNPNGEMSGQVPFKAVRDEAKGITLYELKMEGKYIKDLQPALGGFIGLNVAVNDADYQNGRDNFIQWTKGTADSKSTAFYDSFYFIEAGDDHNQPVKVTGVTAEPSALSLQIGESKAVTATVAPVNAANKAVVWSTDNPEVATVDANGQVKAVGAGKARITVTTADGGFTAVSEITVIKASEPPVSVESVAIEPASLSLQVGENKALTATIAPANATNKAVAWSTDNPEVATVDANGQVKAVGAGKARITVTTADGGFTAVSEITVIKASEPPVSVKSVKLKPASLSLQVGDSKALTAMVAPVNAANKAVAWSTDNPEVATVDANGQVKAVGAGKATITVTTADGGFTAVCEVTVTKVSEPQPPEYVWYDPQPQTPQPPKGTMVVKPEALKNSVAGVVTIEAADGITTVELPSNAAELLQGSKLLVQSAQATLEVPAKALELAGGAISLTLMPLVDPAAQERIASGQQALGAALRTGSSLYEIGLTAGGKEQAAGFAAPVTLRLKADAALQAGRTGIFWLPAAGKPGYIGGEYGEDGWLMAVIERPGTYAVLEVTKTYSDLPAGHWAYEAVAELSAKQVLQGTSATRFEPGRAVTRAEYAAMLVGALRLTETGEHRFADVPADKWYAEAVAIAYKAGLVTGRSASVFDPEGRITREEMVAMTMKAFSLTGSKGGSAAAQPERVFADETAISAWAKPYVQEAAALQLIQGRAAGKFAPKGTAGRAEAAKLIHSLIAV
ncbi:Ig-like domain-containing protein [Paenibacillus sp. GCM10027626]|uniref:Ig-like domain-containing protein n=1 Tax=Paenibacillus sp. GCM10027626 TaxID=3273411 RepID=UPI0036402AE1